MQDGARPHTLNYNMNYLRKKCLILEPWPPNFPDLNPIENLWVIMNNHLGTNRPDTIEEFINILIGVWENISWEIMENLIKSMNKRIELVIEREGQSINGYY